ncbi:CDP-glycerol glycerophosphotransferase family protein [Pelagibacteraceae bacterium]|nr:CDP-glycerol glycerophosphotransferase family protein [Pelagibacteraceae bacterium]
MMNNKIAILINWPREIDMYYQLIKSIPSHRIEIIVNNIKSIERGRNKLSKVVEKILERKKIKYKLFSNIYNKKYYKILLSTGEACSLKINFYSILKFLYAHTLGIFLEKSKISKILIYFFGKPYTGGAFNCKIGVIWYPERYIGKTIVKYPDGMDLKLKFYPYSEYKKIFDIYFTLGNFESKIIKKKFIGKECFVIGYPRYVNLKKKNHIYRSLLNQFNLDPKKKIIFWTPTHVDTKNEEYNNINLWIKKVTSLQDEYNIIIRPHPKTLMTQPDIEKELKKLNYFIDKDPNRKIGELFKVADLVISDYGGTIFSSIYLKKPLILLNLKKNSRFVAELKENRSLDLIVRKKILNLNPNDKVEKVLKYVNISKKLQYKKLIIELKKKYFGLESQDNLKSAKKCLLNYL